MWHQSSISSSTFSQIIYLLSDHLLTLLSFSCLNSSLFSPPPPVKAKWWIQTAWHSLTPAPSKNSGMLSGAWVFSIHFVAENSGGSVTLLENDTFLNLMGMSWSKCYPLEQVGSLQGRTRCYWEEVSPGVKPERGEGKHWLKILVNQSFIWHI